MEGGGGARNTVRDPREGQEKVCRTYFQTSAQEMTAFVLKAYCTSPMCLNKMFHMCFL